MYPRHPFSKEREYTSHDVPSGSVYTVPSRHFTPSGVSRLLYGSNGPSGFVLRSA